MSGDPLPEPLRSSRPTTVVLFANTDWYLWNFRLPLARAIRDVCGAEVVCVSPPGPFGSRIETEGFRWEPLPMHRFGLNPFLDLWTLFRLVHLLRRLKPALVHAFTLKSVVWGGVACRMAGVPAFVGAFTGLGSIFGTEGPSWLKPVLDPLVRCAFGQPRSMGIFQNPEDHAIATIRRWLPSDRTRLIKGSGVDPERFTPLAPTEPFRVVMAARLLRGKGCLTFGELARIVRERHPDVRFELAGNEDPGSPEALTTEELAALRGTPGVHLLGHVEDMTRFYRGAAVMVLPTRYGEGVPRSLLEAAACGLPLVATDTPGCREIVTDGVSGRLHAPEDVAGMANSILNLLADAGLRARMGEGARLTMVDGFSQDQVLRETLGVYRSLGVMPPWEPTT